MDTSNHSMSDLFQQLGLPDSSDAIESFVKKHALSSEEKLIEASFWSEPQAAFLQEAIADDSDWAEVVDQLDARLREH